jgi:hypothetical protein
MLAGSIVIENMNHLAMSFPLRTDGGPSDAELSNRPADRRRIKLQLLFVVPAPQDPNYDFLDQPDREELPRIISVRVPRSLSVAKLRLFVKYIETQLQDIYGRSKRLNFVMICDENSELWKFEFQMPDVGVYYV